MAHASFGPYPYAFVLWSAQNSLLLSTPLRLVKGGLFRTQSIAWDQIQRIEGYDGGIRVVGENTHLEIEPETLFSARDWATVLGLSKVHAPSATWDEASQRLRAGRLEGIRVRLAPNWLYLAAFIAMVVYFNLKA